MFRLVYDARRFFKNFRFVHGVLAFILLATGVASLILSNGSNGSAKVPYFFSAFFAGAWVCILGVSTQKNVIRCEELLCSKY